MGSGVNEGMFGSKTTWSDKALLEPSAFSPPVIQILPPVEEAAWYILRIGSLAHDCDSAIQFGLTRL